MDIKTITTTEGVNEVDFGSSASRFYWFQNLGTTAVQPKVMKHTSTMSKPIQLKISDR